MKDTVTDALHGRSLLAIVGPVNATDLHPSTHWKVQVVNSAIVWLQGAMTMAARPPFQVYGSWVLPWEFLGCLTCHEFLKKVERGPICRF